MPKLFMRILKPLLITLLASTVVLIPTKPPVVSHPSSLTPIVSAPKPAQELPAFKPALLASKVTVKPVDPPKQASGGCSSIRATLARLGVPANQLDAAIQLAMRESTCDEFVVNSIGACGAFQSLPCGKWGQPGTDEYYRGAINYSNSRYGGYNGALAHSLANNWY